MKARKARLKSSPPKPSTSITLTAPAPPPSSAPSGLKLISTPSAPSLAASLNLPKPRRITVPPGLAGQPLRDFRKRTRRALKAEMGDAYDEKLVKFVEAGGGGGGGGGKGGKKRAMVSINELVAAENDAKVRKDADEKRSKRQKKASEKIERQQASESEKGNYVALDCEMVGVGSGGKRSALARATLVGYDGDVLLDVMVKVGEAVTDFRTKYSGVRAKDLKGSAGIDLVTLQKCQKDVHGLISGKVLVGHALSNDLKALMLDHPRGMTRDTARYAPYQRKGKDGKMRPRKLRDLVAENLGGGEQWEGFQEGEHDSGKDARAAMELYKLRRAEWEAEAERKGKASKRKSKGKTGGYNNVAREGDGEEEEEDDFEVDDQDEME